MTTTTAIQKQEAGINSIARQLDCSPEYVQLVKDVYAKGATDLELQLFLQTAQRTGLDPMARQIYCIKRYSNGVSVMSTQVSIDGFRLIADRTGNYVPGREPTYTFDENNRLESATAYIKKLVGGVWHEVSATAFYDEYVQTTKDGNPNSMWKKMPRLMLAKTAESLVLRKAFPAELSGLYTVEEMGNAEDVQSVPAQPHPQKLPDAAPSQKTADMVIKETCTALNNSGDSIKWSNAKLIGYANNFFEFEAPIKNLSELDAEEKWTLAGDLEARLGELQAVSDEHSEVIDAEVEDEEVIR